MLRNIVKEMLTMQQQNPHEITFGRVLIHNLGYDGVRVFPELMDLKKVNGSPVSISGSSESSIHPPAFIIAMVAAAPRWMFHSFKFLG